jgi:hypothetical protein
MHLKNVKSEIHKYTVPRYSASEAHSVNAVFSELAPTRHQGQLSGEGFLFWGVTVVTGGVSGV